MFIQNPDISSYTHLLHFLFLFTINHSTLYIQNFLSIKRYFKISTISLSLSLSLSTTKERNPSQHIAPYTRMLSFVKHLDYAFHSFPNVTCIPSTPCFTRYSRQTSRNDSIHTHRYKSLGRICRIPFDEIFIVYAGFIISTGNLTRCPSILSISNSVSTDRNCW